MKWNAAIVGLGQIGMGYDFHQTGVQLTHATAYHLHSNFELIAGIDPNSTFRSQFEDKFKARAFSTIQEFASDPLSRGIHCVSIATPTRMHDKTFFEVLSHQSQLTQLRAILCEKPVSDSLENARAMVAKARDEKLLLATNYIRRTVPEFRALQVEIKNGVWGSLQKGVVFYSKGLLNSGTHWIDLMRFYFGEPEEVRLLHQGSRRPVISDVQDYEPDFLLRYRDGDIYFCACDENSYTVGSVDLFMTKGCLRFNESGFSMERFFVGKDPLGSKLQVLLPHSLATKTQLSQNMRFVLDDLDECLQAKRELLSSGESGLKTLEIAGQLIRALPGDAARD